MYYDYERVLSYNSFINILIGERGVGKTYGITKYVIERFLKHGERFVYIRRYKTELKKSAPKFFEKVKDIEEFKDFKFKYHSNEFYIDDKLAGYSIVLSTAQQLKGSNYNGVKWIIYDEFIVENSINSRYLNDEVTLFLGVIETISRMQDVRCFLLGNSVTTNNPYFNYFDLQLPYNNDIKTYRDGLILVQYMNNEEYRQQKKLTRFGRLVANTPYERYAINNEFSNDISTFIAKKSGNAKFSFTLLYNNEYYGVWTDFIENKFYISSDYYKNSFTYACTLKDHKPDTIFIKMAKRSFQFKLLITAFQSGQVYFENKKIRDKVIDIFKILI